jgi:hypothetical protein
MSDQVSFDPTVVIMPQWRKTIGAVVVYTGLVIGLALAGTWVYLFSDFDTYDWNMPTPIKVSYLIHFGVPVVIVFLFLKLFFWIGKLINPTINPRNPFRTSRN